MYIHTYTFKFMKIIQTKTKHRKFSTSKILQNKIPLRYAFTANTFQHFFDGSLRKAKKKKNNKNRRELNPNKYEVKQTYKRTHKHLFHIYSQPY